MCSTIYNIVHSPWGGPWGLHCNKWDAEVPLHTVLNVAAVTSWVPGVSMGVGLVRVVTSIVGIVKTSQELKDQQEAFKVETRATRNFCIMQLGRGAIELIPVGFAVVMILDIGFTIARWQNPYVDNSGD